MAIIRTVPATETAASTVMIVINPEPSISVNFAAVTGSIWARFDADNNWDTSGPASDLVAPDASAASRRRLFNNPPPMATPMAPAIFRANCVDEVTAPRWFQGTAPWGA